MHPVDPPTWSFAFLTLVHFHLLRPLEPHPLSPPRKNKNLKPLTQKKRIQISSPTFQIPKIFPPIDDDSCCVKTDVKVKV
jgi:hypothetical protein